MIGTIGYLTAKQRSLPGKLTSYKEIINTVEGLFMVHRAAKRYTIN